MPEETKPESSPAAETEAREPRTHKPAAKSRRKAEIRKVREEESEPISEAISERPDKGSDPAPAAAEGKRPETKRPNRRRRGKGKTQGKDDQKESADEEPAGDAGERDETPQEKDSVPNSQRPPQTPRRKIDPEKVAKNAWKIFLAEVSEEGVALIGDNNARELARRCFRLSEIFLEEEERRN